MPKTVNTLKAYTSQNYPPKYNNKKKNAPLMKMDEDRFMNNLYEFKRNLEVNLNLTKPKFGGPNSLAQVFCIE